MTERPSWASVDMECPTTVKRDKEVKKYERVDYEGKRRHAVETRGVRPPHLCLGALVPEKAEFIFEVRIRIRIRMQMQETPPCKEEVS